MTGRPPGPRTGPIRVIFNPAAGWKGGIRTNKVTKADIEAVLHDVGIEAEIVETTSAGEAQRVAADAVRQRYATVVAAGGDGTIGTVATELLGSETALGVLPGGSIMNIARMLGIPRDLSAAAAILACGVIRRIDVGEARGRPFFEAGSVGMNAAMFREAQRFEKGDRTSVARTIWVAIRYRPARMEVELDDRVVRTRALAVVVANGPYTGAGMTVAPRARVDDGRFDVTIFEHFSKWELIRHLASIAFGRRRYAPHLSTYRSTLARISSIHPLPARADSHDLGTTPVEFRVLPAALPVIVPPDGPPKGAPSG
jgi:YegS/Rv2252/BmrU family lipid kinase